VFYTFKLSGELQGLNSQLRQMNFIDTPEVIAKQFHLTHVNRYLKEATFDHKGDGPGFTIALDENGNYVDSFLSH
jgi:hypothetical protein